MKRDFRNITLKNVGRVTTAAVLIIALSGTSVTTAIAADPTTGTTTTSSQNVASSNTTTSTGNKDAGITTQTKDETVYVFANPDGSVKNTVVSDSLKNVNAAPTLDDVSSLSDITNTEGNQAYTVNADGSISWAADGSDIYYQGSTEQQAPVMMKVTYTLDGQTVTPEEIAGKTGKVTIRFDYTNNSYTDETIDGSTQRIYTPFVVVTGMVLDNANFRNIEVTNAQTVNDGDRTIVSGYAMPGMQHNLGIDTGTIEIPDYIEVSADAEDFTLGSTGTIVTNEFYKDIDTDKYSFSSLADDISSLENGMTQLMSGSDSLTEGLAQLASGASAVDSGVQTLNTGAGTLEAGTSVLQTSTSAMNESTEALAAASAQVNGGLDQLTNGTSSATGLVDAVGSIGDASTSGTLMNGAAQISLGAENAIAAIGTGLGDTDNTLLKGVEGTQAYLQAGEVALTTGDGTASNPGIQSTLTKASTAISAAMTYLNGANGALNAQAIQTAIMNLQSDVTALGTDATALGTDAAAIDATAVSGLATTLTTAKSGIDDGVDALNDAASADSEIQSAQSDLDGIDETGMTQDQIDAVESAKTHLSSAESDVSGASAAATALSGVAMDVDDAAASVTTVADSVTTAKAATTQAQTDVTQAQSDVTDAATALSSSNVPTALTDIGTALVYLGASPTTSGALQAVNGANTGITSVINSTIEPVINTQTGTNTKVSQGLLALRGNSATATSAPTGMYLMKYAADSLTGGLATLKSGGITPDGRMSAGLQGAVDVLGSATTQGTLLYGTAQIAGGTAQLAAVSPALVSGIEQINNGATQLSSGTSQLAANTPTLATGAQSAAAGAQTLREGIHQFNDEGIQKIVELYNANLAGLSDRLDATINSGKSYDSFSGKSSMMEGSVRFIYETDSINKS